MTVRTTAEKHSMPNFELRSVLLFSALATGAALTTHAQSSPPYPPGSSPASAQLAAAATAADIISPDKILARDVQAAFNRAYTNADGKLSREEARHFPAVEARFDQIDGNHDNFISRDEFDQATGAGS